MVVRDGRRFNVPVRPNRRATSDRGLERETRLTMVVLNFDKYTYLTSTPSTTTTL